MHIKKTDIKIIREYTLNENEVKIFDLWRDEMSEENGIDRRKLDYTLDPYLFFKMYLYGEFVGVLLLCEIYDDTLFITSINIKEECRRQGLGSMLMDAVYDYMKSSKYKKIQCRVIYKNDKSEKFMIKHGFSTESIVMEKSIDE